MIWAMIFWYFLGGPGAISGAMLTSADVKDVNTRMVAVVDDPARQESAAQTLKELKKRLKSYEKAFAASGKQLNKLYRVHAENRTEAMAILDTVNADWQAAQQSALDARFALRDNLTEDEWNELYGRNQP